MASDDFACVTEVEQTIRLNLSPTFSHNCRTGIYNELESVRYKYSPIFEGILVDYDNIAVLSTSADMGDDGFRLVCKIKGRFFVFTPHVGSVLKAQINRLSREHVGCVLFNEINLSIRLTPEITRELASFLFLDGDILFEVTQIDNNMWDIVRISGQITPKCIRLIKTFPRSPHHVHRFFDDNGNVLPDASEEIIEHAEDSQSSTKKRVPKVLRNNHVQENIMSYLQDSLVNLKDTTKSAVNGVSDQTSDDVDVKPDIASLNIIDPVIPSVFTEPVSETPSAETSKRKSVKELTKDKGNKKASEKAKSGKKERTKSNKKKERTKKEKNEKRKKDKSKSSKETKPKDKAKKLKQAIKDKQEKAKKDLIEKKKEKKKKSKEKLYPVDLSAIKVEP